MDATTLRQRDPARTSRCRTTTATAVLAASLGLLVLGDAAGAATKKATTTKKPTATASTAKFCAAAKAWKAFEDETLEAGPYDEAWVLASYNVIRPLQKNAPKAIRGAAAQFFMSLLSDRATIAGIRTIDDVADIGWLREYAADETSNAQLSARDAVGAYILKTCKVDVLQPFRDLAKGFE